jgi:glycosyltransferase involved in cell wall biosynthesis
MEVLHLTTWAGRQSFGVGAIVLGLAECQRIQGIDAVIWSTDDAVSMTEILGSSEITRDILTTHPIVGPMRLGLSPAMERAAIQNGSRFSVLHQHGIWTACSRASNLWRERYQYPVVIAPHGSLDDWALRKSRSRKWLAARAYECKNLRSAACLHATAHSEIAHFRDYGLTNPIALIPNGVTQQWLESSGDAARFREQHRLSPDKRVLLFLSRVTPKKGLPLLLNAMASIKDRLADWLLVIAGPDEFGHLSELHAQTQTLGLADLVRFTGALHGQERRDAFASAEAFILPTYSEGAPMAVLEALGMGLPVLTTHGTHWEDLVHYDCGWWVEVSEAALREALLELIEYSPDVLHRMGEKGKALIQREYTWATAAARCIELYNWLLQQGERPDFVTT